MIKTSLKQQVLLCLLALVSGSTSLQGHSTVLLMASGGFLSHALAATYKTVILQERIQSKESLSQQATNANDHRAANYLQIVEIPALKKKKTQKIMLASTTALMSAVLFAMGRRACWD